MSRRSDVETGQATAGNTLVGSAAPGAQRAQPAPASQVFNEKVPRGTAPTSSGSTLPPGQPDAQGVNGEEPHSHHHHKHEHFNFHLARGKDFGNAVQEDIQIAREFWARFSGRDRWVPWTTSARNIVMSSPLNVLWLLLPLAWAAFFLERAHEKDPSKKSWGQNATFILCFLAIIPLEQTFDFLGEQMKYYLGRSLGDLLIITLNNAVEGTLAIVLLIKCELRLLQATIAGVVILHLLLIPGMAFLTGGARILEQNLHAHNVQMNQSLLTIGVFAIMIPTALFTALNRGSIEPSTEATALISDASRGDFLKMSRGVAIILLVIYIASRIYLHNPPGENNALVPHNAPEEMKHEEQHLAEAKPKVNVWSAMIVLLITIGIMAFTAECLVESIEHVREEGKMTEEFFGLVILPIVSFAADGAVATIYFMRYMFALFLGRPQPPAQLAKGRAIDMSVQFTLFWLPFLVLLGWWTEKPLHLMFDLYEVTLLVGACFLVNTVTADAKTNWVEGFILVGLYGIIACVSWFYTGQESSVWMLRCASVLIAGEHEELAHEQKGDHVGGGAGSEGGHGNATEVAELAARMAVKMVRRMMEERANR